jgi:hypothetical protein
MIPYQAGQLGLSQARAADGLYTDQGVFVPFSAVQLQTSYAASLADFSNFAATATKAGTRTDLAAGTGPFGGSSLYSAPGATFPYQEYVSYNRASQQGLGGATEFTVDIWINPDVGGSFTSTGILGQFAVTLTGAESQYVLSTNGISGSNVSLVFQLHLSTGSVQYSLGGANGCLTGQWNHIRVSQRVNPSTGLAELRWFVNGVFKQVTSTTSRTVYETANTVPHQVGLLLRGSGANSRFPGYIGPIRVIKGYALNTTNSDIIVPSTYFPVY